MTSHLGNQFDSREGNFFMVRILANRNNTFSIFHINAQSLLPKIDEFRYLFESSDIDAICVSETWFNKEISDGVLGVEGYRLFRSDRSGNGGGVAIYIKSHISSKLVMCSCERNQTEYIFIELNCHHNKMLLGCVYRPNKNIRLDNLTDKLEILSVRFSDVIIVGDFNSNILVTNELTENMSTFGLSPVNNSRPTHFTTTSSTLLDLFFVNQIHNVMHYEQLSATSFSKHDAIFISYNFMTGKPAQNFTYRNFKNIDYQCLYHDIEQTNWDLVYHIHGVNEKLMFLNDTIVNIYNDRVPISTKKLREGVRPWFTNEAKALILQRDRSYNLWKRYKTLEYFSEFRKARKAVVKKIKRDKTAYYSNKFNSATDSKKKWKCIKEIGIGKSLRRPLDVDVNLINENFVNIPQPKANADFYNENSNIPGSLMQFDFQTVHIFDVVEAFYKMKSNSIGLDGIDPRFVKIILPWIIQYITHIFNCIIMTGIFPKLWKHAKIVPVPKPGNEYRPIAILPYFSKVFERLLHTNIYTYVNENNLLTSRQSGFRPRHSCITALSDVVEDIRENLDEGKLSFLVLLDHSKAFDTVHHSILSMKLFKQFGFSVQATGLIQSYLADRTQSVVNNDQISRSLPVTRGVPQGSILGPLLYSLYANDLPQQLSFSNIQMYADDIQLYLSSTKDSIVSKVNELNSDLEKIFIWASANGLKINPNKSNFLIICKNSIRPEGEIDISIGGARIKQVNTARNLGVTFNWTLTWSDHISQACGRVYSKLRSLWATQYFTPLSIRTLLAKTYLLPTLSYGSEIFSGCSSCDMRKLNTTYNNIVRYVYGLKKFDRVTPFSRRFMQLPFNKFLNMKCLIFLHNIIVKKEPEYLYDRLKFARSQRGRYIIQLRHRNHASECQFFIMSIRLWNQLPNYLQSTDNAIKFRKLLNDYLND